MKTFTLSRQSHHYNKLVIAYNWCCEHFGEVDNSRKNHAWSIEQKKDATFRYADFIFKEDEDATLFYLAHSDKVIHDL